jgi:glucose/arabinose dehydrogenase
MRSTGLSFGLCCALVSSAGQGLADASDPLNAAPTGTNGLPPGFQATTLVTGLNQPTVVEFAPDGRMFIGERGGRVLVLQDGALLPDPLIQIPADASYGERGLVGLVVDPGFATNGFLYVYFTAVGGPSTNRVSRFTVIGNTAALESQFVVWQNPGPAQQYHHGGTILFGPDGCLYISTGDQFEGANAQTLTNQHGKILRVRPDGTIPLDNPFSTSEQPSPIWAYGLRNPFRFTFDAETGQVFIGDVGGNGGGSWEEINLGARGANYGWPNQEGPNCVSGDCADYTFPIHSYVHTDPNYNYQGLWQASITLGPVYRHASFPAAYRGNLFFGDYANRWIRRLVFDTNGVPVGDPVFYRQPNTGSIVDLKLGPDGALYYVTIGLPWNGPPDEGAVHRISYAGASNQPPVAMASAFPTNGPVPLAVQFGSTNSFDPEGDSLTYQWEFGDGATSTLPHPLHSYTNAGEYTARVRVSDGLTEAFSKPIRIRVGLAPVAFITAPVAGASYRAGDIIEFRGGATDPEDGALPPARLTWQVLLRHGGHVHPFLGPTNGIASGSFTVPGSGHAAENTSYEIVLTATDADGLSGSAAVAIAPVVSALSLETLPEGIPLFLDGDPVNTPLAFQSLEGFEHVIAVPATHALAGDTYVFRYWSDGDTTPTRHLVAPPGGRTLRAGYARVQQNQKSVTVSVSAVSRNADYSPAFNVSYANFFDANGLCAGRDSGRPNQAAMQFALPIPPGAQVLNATLRVRATSDQSGSPTLSLRAYAMGNAAPFISGSATPLTAHHPLLTNVITWNPPKFIPGTTNAFPDVAELAQAVVNRSDWASGQYFGLVVDGTPTSGNHWRCWNNLQSGFPPTLTMTYSADESDVADIDGDGIPDDWEIACGLDATLAADATSDSDGDGHTAWQEYMANTNPAEASSHLKAHIRAGTNPEIWFLSSTGRVYTLEHSLEPTVEWTAVRANIHGTGSTLTLTLTNAARSCFYRLSVRMP